MEKWVLLTFLYAICTGFFQCAKKKAVEKSSIYEVLAWYSLISFVLVAFKSKNVLGINLISIGVILIKAIIVTLAWFTSLYALKRMSVSLYGVVNLSRVVFTIILSLIFLGEKLTLTVFTGMVIVIIGLVLVNTKTSDKEKKKTSFITLLIMLASCLLNSISAIIDKKILVNITSSQLQFWFLLFITIISWVVLLKTKPKISLNVLKKNYWILITALALTVGDRLLFMANEIAESKVTIMTIIKQISAIEIVILGKIMFKEKKIIKKLLCSILIILGIIIILI